MGQMISLNTRHGRVSAWKSTPHVTARGAVVIIHEVYGLNPHIRQVADRFAGLGYIAVAPAMFDRVHPSTVLPYDSAGTARGWEITEELGIDGALDAVRGGYDHLEAETRVAVVGFGWGGTIALLANTRIGIPAVSYYGSRNLQYLRERPKAPLLLHFGEFDPLISADDVAQHREQLPNAEILVWPAGHGFNCDARRDYHAESAQAAMARTGSFLRKHLQHSV